MPEMLEFIQPNTGFDVASPISRHLGSLAKNEHLLNLVSSCHPFKMDSSHHKFLEASPQSIFKSTPRDGASAGSVRRCFRTLLLFPAHALPASRSRSAHTPCDWEARELTVGLILPYYSSSFIPPRM
jgi:hypothetical protein